MLSFFRRVSKSKIGTGVMAAVLIAILGGFALADLSNFGTGNLGLGSSSGTLARVGDQEVTDREMSQAMERRLQQTRQQRANADYASVIADFNPLLESLLDERSLIAFGDKFDFPLSKRMIDAEIAQLPGTKGLNGQFSEESYRAFLAQQRLTDAQVRQVLQGGLAQRMLLTPVVTNARVPVGIASPYASMLLEAREGEAVNVPLAAFKSGLQPTEAQVQQYYNANRVRYMIPEQRTIRIARIGPEQLANVTASDQEITAYYNANKTTYAPSDSRSLTQVVVQDQASATAIAQRAKGGAPLAAAAAPAGANAAVTTLADQTRGAYASVAGDKAANEVFAAAKGTVVGPLQSQFGWIVAKIDSVKSGGKTIEQARAEIAAKITADKRKSAMEDMVDKAQSALDSGNNFTEAAAAAKLSPTTTPLVTATGVSRTDATYKLPPELAPALKTGFEIAPNDPPEIITLPQNAGYALVSPEQVVPAAPAPLATIRDKVATDWVNDQAMQRARAAASQIAAKASGNVLLGEAVKSVGTRLPVPQNVAARRIQISNAQGNVAPALKMLFAALPGHSKMAPAPDGFVVVKVNKMTPGNAVIAPGLIGQVASELNQSTPQDYAQQFVADVKREMKAKRNESAIRAVKARLVSSGG